jgi:hypothetical protein
MLHRGVSPGSALARQGRARPGAAASLPTSGAVDSFHRPARAIGEGHLADFTAGSARPGR